MKPIRSITQAGSNLKDVKLINRVVVFRAIREAGTISRADLAKQTGLNPATLTHITRELLGHGLITEAGSGAARIGRRSSLLRINSTSGHILAVRLARHNIQGFITDLDLSETIIHTASSTFLSHPIESNLPILLNFIETLIATRASSGRPFLGLGFLPPDRWMPDKAS